MPIPRCAFGVLVQVNSEEILAFLTHPTAASVPHLRRSLHPQGLCHGMRFSLYSLCSV